MIATLLLAAGKSSRMGARDKLLEIVDGVPLLRQSTGQALLECVGALAVMASSVDRLPSLRMPKRDLAWKLGNARSLGP